eukprot:Sspe_Gene.69679::Locus_41083_Transcript_1_1_Confidence_1.000_Length_1757::g.69679::m.69679
MRESVVVALLLLVGDAAAVLCSAPYTVDGVCYSGWYRTQIYGSYRCCPVVWTVRSGRCSSPSNFVGRCPVMSRPPLKCSRESPRSTQGPRCSPCLKTCRGLPGCCTGRGCMCEDQCVTSQTCAPGWVTKISCPNPYLPCGSIGCCKSGWGFVSGGCQAPAGYTGSCPKQVFPPPATPSPARRTPTPPRRTPRPPTYPGTPTPRVPVAEPVAARLEVRLHFTMDMSITQRMVDGLWRAHSTIVDVVDGENAECVSLCAEGGECWPCLREAPTGARHHALATSPFVLTVLVDTMLSPGDAESRVHRAGAEIVSAIPTARYRSVSVGRTGGGGSSDTAGIILGCVLGGVGLVALGALLCCCCRRRGESQGNTSSVKGVMVEKVPQSVPQPMAPQQEPYGVVKEV